MFSENLSNQTRPLLNMMYPRLKLARNILKDDGVIFISIDDNEVSNLRKMCDEIFGEENFIANFIWEKRTNRENRKEVSYRHDNVICYTKNRSLGKAINQLPMNEKALSNYKNPDDDPRGLWKSDPATAQAGHGTKSQFYELEAPNGKVHSLQSGRCWLYTKDIMNEAIKDNRIWFGKDGNGVPRIKTYLQGKDRGLTPESIIFSKDASTNEAAKNVLKELFNGIAVFDTPKPTELIKVLLQVSCNDGVVLDFFAGSSATAHAVMQLNAEDGGNRKFIMVQLPEFIDKKSEASKSGYKTIAEISKERIRRAAAKIKEENPEYEGDLGFKVFKLDSTNIKPWEADFDSLNEDYMGKMIESIKSDRHEEDVLYEVLLKYGLDLTLPITERAIAGQKVFDIGMGALIICLSNSISLELVEGIARLKVELNPEIMRVVFKDSGFKNDVVKTNAVQILKQAGIVDVRSL